MAITLEANYSKKIGLPGYSSHQYSLTVRKEVADIAQVQRESEQLHATLQNSVDNELRNQGWLPASESAIGNLPATNGNGAWNCSDKQKELILKLAEEHNLDLNSVEELAQARFDKPLRELNKLNASSLIDELLAQQGNRNGGTNCKRRPKSAAGWRSK
jgi:hypothetical protein